MSDSTAQSQEQQQQQPESELVRQISTQSSTASLKSQDSSSSLINSDLNESHNNNNQQRHVQLQFELSKVDEKSEQDNNNKIESGDKVDSNEVKKEDKNNNDNNAETKETKKDDKALLPMVSFWGMFRFASFYDHMLMFVGSIAALGNGCALPLWAVVFGSTIADINRTQDQILDAIVENVKFFVIIGGASFVLSWLALTCWMYVSERMTKRMREEYVKAALRQNPGWFDSNHPGTLCARLAEDSIEYQKGTGEKIATFLQHTSTFFTGVIIGLVRGYHLGLVIIGITPLMGIAVGGLTVALTTLSGKSQEAYANAGSIADEVLSGIRTVVAFGAEQREVERYDAYLGASEQAGIKRGLFQGISLGVTNLVMFSSYGLCLWFGSWLIHNNVTNPYRGENYDGSDVVTIFFAILFGAMSIGQAGPTIQFFTTARAAAYRMFQIIDTPSAIDSLSDEGNKLESLHGDLELRDVTFSYPTRRDMTIFKNFNLQIPAGRTIALVGESGSGKSTIIGLLERYYDVDGGAVLIDGVDVRSLNVAWWRRNLALVSQEPVLFSGSIRDNVTFGLTKCTDQEVEDACKAANAHSFITKLPHGYATNVGEDGSKLSGGQKQRVAIARALIKNPKILLLDEATSALDNENERLVQDALERLMKNRTTVIIAHRLSTVMNADQIFFLKDGVICEHGTHQELLAKDSFYAGLWKAQSLKVSPDGENTTTTTTNPDDIIDEKQEPLSPADRFSASVSKHAHPTSTKDRHSANHQSEQKQTNGTKTTATTTTDDTNKDVKKAPTVPDSRVVELIKEDWIFITIGIISCMALGVWLPLWAIAFGDMLKTFFISDKDEALASARNSALFFFGLGWGLCFGALGQQWGFAVAGEHLTRKLRRMTFAAVLRQDMSFFDDENNNTRIITTRLSSDASYVHAGVTQRTGLLVQIMVTMITGFTIAFVKGWKLAFVVLSIGPLLMISSTFHLKLIQGFANEGKKAFENAGRISGDALANIRTVAAFNAEKQILQDFSQSLEKPLQLGLRTAHSSGIGFGFSQLVLFCSYALCFWYGAKLVSDGDMNFGDMIQTVFAVLITAVGIGQAAQLAPDIQKANDARDNIFQMLDRQPKIDSYSTEGETANFTQGDMDFKQLDFAYPTRPEIQVMKNFNLHIKPGQIVALVGTSGSGKSTLVGLLLRYYDPLSGSIVIDGQDIKQLNVKSLRASMSLVSQEPRLFNASIADNIRYGKPDATDAEVVAAAQAANIHDMILSFPEGYNTVVGYKGSKLSGGQKQRVAIARALVRQPKILLLDEASAALNSENEKHIQVALEEIMRDRSRTIINIAHRLSTIRNADLIVVLDKGVVAEMGDHETLMTKNGLYVALARAHGVVH